MNNKQNYLKLYAAFTVIVLLIGALIASCMPGAQNAEKENVFAVNVIPASKGEINDYIQVNGDVQSLASIDIFANNNGTVIGIDVSLGQYVGAGQIIARVDPSRPGQNFLPNPVRSPIAGTITALPVRVGSTITIQTPIAKIARTSELEIVSYIAERFIGQIKKDLNALIRFDAFPGQVFNARIREVSPILDAASRTMEVKLRFTGDARAVKAGMFGEVKIITTTKKDIVKIPAGCLVRRFDKTYVFVVKDKSWVERREVTPGISIDNKLEILSGLAPDELVVTQGQRVLEDKAKVNVIETLAALGAEDKIE